jgi:uncharacterized membrane protein
MGPLARTQEVCTGANRRTGVATSNTGAVPSMQQNTTRIAFLVASAIGATVALPMLAKAGPAPAPSFQAEKCYGVNAAGKNDCASSNSHSCAGEAKRASDPKSWIFVPTGTCQKIQGGSLTPKET